MMMAISDDATTVRWTSNINDMSCFKKPSSNYAIMSERETREAARIFVEIGREG